MKKETRSKLIKIATSLLWPNGPSDCIDDYPLIMRKRAISRLVEEIAKHTEFKRKVAVEISEIIKDEMRGNTLKPEEKTCLDCRFEPEWDKSRTGIGRCRWLEVKPMPISMYIGAAYYMEIPKDGPYTGCPAWEAKP